MAKKCPTTGKTKFFSFKAARKAITFIWGNDPSIGLNDLHAYRCPACQSVHVGHRVPKVAREKK